MAHFFEGIGLAIDTAVLYLIHHRVLSGNRQRVLADIETLHRHRSRQGRMNAEGAGMAEYFQYIRSSRELGRSEPILSLIAKPAGLLPSFDIDEKLRGSFVNLNLRRTTAAEKSPIER